jgi:FHA domain
MATCPSGHESASDDFCDVCGVRIGAEVLTLPGPGPGGDVCPRCGMSRTGQFCEACGYDFTVGAPDLPPQPAPPAAPQPVAPSAASPSPSAGATWTAVVTADRAYYDSVQAAGGPDAAEIRFPAYCPERRFRLSGAEVRVGRRSMSRGIVPEIDLTGPPADPGVSRLHALLVAAQGGTWSVVDPGSENGTLLNGNEIPPGEAVPLHDGDRIHLGAWTELTITRGD